MLSSPLEYFLSLKVVPISVARLRLALVDGAGESIDPGVLEPGPELPERPKPPEAPDYPPSARQPSASPDRTRPSPTLEPGTFPRRCRGWTLLTFTIYRRNDANARTIHPRLASTTDFRTADSFPQSFTYLSDYKTFNDFHRHFCA